MRKTFCSLILILLAGTAVTGSAAPGLFNLPTKVVSLGNPILNEAGNLAFRAVVSGTANGAPALPCVLMESGTDNALGVLSMAGSLAPDRLGVTGLTGTFASLSDPVSTGKNQVAFIGQLKTGGVVTKSNNAGVWVATSGSLALAARTQEHAPDCLPGVNFSGFASLVLPEKGGAVLLATVAGTGVSKSNAQGIWAADAAGTFHMVARQGDVIVLNGVPKIISSISIFKSTVGAAGQTRSFNLAGDLIYKVTFTDKTQALRKIVFP